jgi:hypothetical protein
VVVRGAIVRRPRAVALPERTGADLGAGRWMQRLHDHDGTGTMPGTPVRSTCASSRGTTGGFQQAGLSLLGLVLLVGTLLRIRSGAVQRSGS